MPFLAPLTNKSSSRPNFPLQSPHAPFLFPNNSLYPFVSDGQMFRRSELYSTSESGLGSLIIDPVTETACQSFDGRNGRWMRMMEDPKIRQTFYWRFLGVSSA